MGFIFAVIFLGGAVAVFILASRVAFLLRSLQLQLRHSRQQCAQTIDFLNHFSKSLATVEEIDHGMQLVAHYLCDLLAAESLAIFTVDVDPADEQQKLRGAAVAGMFPAFTETTEALLAKALSKAKYRLEHLRHEYIAFGDGILGTAARDKASILIADASQYPDRKAVPARVRTLIVAPMLVERRFVGIICAVNCRDERRLFCAEDLRLLENLSFQAALACNLVGIYSERSKQERLLQELHLGREIQQSLLPAALPDWGEYTFSAFSQPALEVGGDYYDFVPIDANRLMMVVADASGKGVPACMLMAMGRSFVRSMVEHYHGVEGFLEELSRRLYTDTDRAHFLTMAVVVIDKETNVCECGCAGHPALLLRLPDGHLRAITPEGPALGLLPDELAPNFDTFAFCFHPGTSLLLFTDGITEALNSNGEEFGLERLKQLWGDRSLVPENAGEFIIRKVRDFAGEVPQADDQTMAIVIRH